MPLAAQSRDEPAPYCSPPNTTSGVPSVPDRPSTHRNIDVCCTVGALGVTAFDAVQHLVLDADIGKGAAHHDLVVAAARTIGVEVTRLHLTFGSGTYPQAWMVANRPGGRDVVGCDHVAQNHQNLGASQCCQMRAWLRPHAMKIMAGSGYRSMSAASYRFPVAGTSTICHFSIALEHIGIFGLERLVEVTVLSGTSLLRSRSGSARCLS